MSCKIPFMSRPYGGTPPAAFGVRVNGGKPSVYDAAPGVTDTCDATGMVFFAPDAANGRGIFDGI
jgi:hypothetical protein